MMKISHFIIAAVTVGAALVPDQSDAAPSYASDVVAYVPGTIRSDYQLPASALGAPSLFSASSPFSDAYVVTPFNAPYAASELTGIGAGGRLVLQLARAAETGHGFTLGVHAGVNLTNVGGAGGQASSPALALNDRQADVRVSYDGVNWVPLASDVVFDVPSNAYSAGVTTPAGQTTAGTVQADYGKPFTVVDNGVTRAGRLSDFDGLTYGQMLTLLNGSAGGTWFDLTNVPLPGVRFVEFGVDPTDDRMFVDAVVAVPEPLSGGAVVLASLLLAGRRRRMV
jgi:hypothetical protein